MDKRVVQTTIVGLKSDCRAQPDLLRVASFEAAQTYIHDLLTCRGNKAQKVTVSHITPLALMYAASWKMSCVITGHSQPLQYQFHQIQGYRDG
jgi:hypothetical protein